MLDRHGDMDKKHPYGIIGRLQRQETVKQDRHIGPSSPGTRRRNTPCVCCRPKGIPRSMEQERRSVQRRRSFASMLEALCFLKHLPVCSGHCPFLSDGNPRDAERPGPAQPFHGVRTGAKGACKKVRASIQAARTTAHAQYRSTQTGLTRSTSIKALTAASVRT